MNSRRSCSARPCIAPGSDQACAITTATQLIPLPGVVLIAFVVMSSLNSVACCGQQNQTGATTRVFFGGTILTVDENFTETEALAIRGKKIVAVGDKESVVGHFPKPLAMKHRVPRFRQLV